MTGSKHTPPMRAHERAVSEPRQWHRRSLSQVHSRTREDRRGPPRGTHSSRPPREGHPPKRGSRIQRDYYTRVRPKTTRAPIQRVRPKTTHTLLTNRGATQDHLRHNKYRPYSPANEVASTKSAAPPPQYIVPSYTTRARLYREYYSQRKECKRRGLPLPEHPQVQLRREYFTLQRPCQASTSLYHSPKPRKPPKSEPVVARSHTHEQPRPKGKQGRSREKGRIARANHLLKHVSWIPTNPFRNKGQSSR